MAATPRLSRFKSACSPSGSGRIAPITPTSPPSTVSISMLLKASEVLGSVRRLAFGASSARTVTRWMGRSRPSLPRCAGLLTSACKRSMRRYGSNGSSARLETSGLGGFVLDLPDLFHFPLAARSRAATSRSG